MSAKSSKSKYKKKLDTNEEVEGGSTLENENWKNLTKTGHFSLLWN